MVIANIFYFTQQRSLILPVASVYDVRYLCLQLQTTATTSNFWSSDFKSVRLDLLFLASRAKCTNRWQQ